MRASVIFGVLLVLVGLVWIGQGLGLLRGSSFMVDDMRWAVAGAGAVTAGAGSWSRHGADRPEKRRYRSGMATTAVCSPVRCTATRSRVPVDGSRRMTGDDMSAVRGTTAFVQRPAGVRTNPRSARAPPRIASTRPVETSTTRDASAATL